jgi:hypothetical protein
MTDYRRNFIAGGSFFFTVNLGITVTVHLTDQPRAAGRASRHVVTGERIQQGARPKANAASGSDVIGSAAFAMRTISRLISITSTLPRSNFRRGKIS